MGGWSMSNEAENLAQEFRLQYNLTYRCSINLEGTINNLLLYKLNIEQITDILTDIFNCIEFVKGDCQ